MADIPAYVVVDHILKSENEQITEQNTFNVSFTQLVEGDRDAIADWIKEDLQYNELKNAPALPEDINEESPAYETINEERKIKGFKEVAFTGEYSDLSGAPGIPAAGFDNGVVKDFNPVAFTGVTDLSNVQVSEILDLRSYGNGVSTLGQDSIYIEGFPSGLGTAVSGFCNKFSLNKGKKPYYIITNAIQGGKVYQVLDAQIVGPGGADGYYYYKIDVASVNTSTYPYVNGTKGQSVLENIEITSKLGCFIFDIVNNCIYYKSENVNADIELPELPELAEVAISGSYNHLKDKPIIPQVPEDTINGDSPAYETIEIDNQEIRQLKSLKEIAFTGNYDDLVNQIYIFNPGQFIYQYNNQSDSWTTLISDELILLQQCGFVSQRDNFKAWIRNIDKLYNIQNSDGRTLKEELYNLYQNFNAHKNCFLFSNGLYVPINNIMSNMVNGTLINMYISTLVTQNNFETELINHTVNTDSDVNDIINELTVTIYNSLIIIDFNNNLLYSQYQRIYPSYSTSLGIKVSQKNEIKPVISTKENNIIQIIDEQGKEGFYATIPSD